MSCYLASGAFLSKQVAGAFLSTSDLLVHSRPGASLSKQAGGASLSRDGQCLRVDGPAQGR